MAAFSVKPPPVQSISLCLSHGSSLSPLSPKFILLSPSIPPPTNEKKRFLSSQFFPSHGQCIPCNSYRVRKCTFRNFPRATSQSAVSPDIDTLATPDSVLLWFKHDLRLDDHPGLVASLPAQHVTPVFVFDPDIVNGLSESYLAALLSAVRSLRNSLRSVGSDLIVRCGSAPDVISSLAREVGATEVCTESEVETGWRQLATAVADKLPDGAKDKKNQTTKFKTWEASLYSWQENLPFQNNFKDYKKNVGPRILPLEAPSHLPPLPSEISPGNIPTQGELLGSKFVFPGQENKETARAKQDFKWMDDEISSENTLDYFRGFLRIQEPTSRSDWQEFYFYVYQAEKSPAASFPNLFRIQMSLGMLSRRRIQNEIIEYEIARGGGRISPFGFSTFTSISAATTVEAQEFHEQLARRDVTGVTRGGHQVKYWRWRGHLVEYTSAGKEGPPILLVHGFGAFWDHFGDNIKVLAARKNRVWAVTMVGFGRSEKPRLPYTQYLWSDFIHDFIVQVIREPVLLAGNSIGGYTAASVASSWPSLVSHLVLLNSAGRIIANPEPISSLSPTGEEGGSGSKFPRFLAWFVSRLLFLYLQRNVGLILKRCYPKNPDRANDSLVSEIIRASYDPGAAEVVESAFYLPKPRALNALLEAYGGPVLVVQGKLDPLNDAVGRAKLLKSAYPKATVRLVEAGHCPHDEIPEEVSIILDEFMKSKVILGTLEDKLGSGQVSKLFAEAGSAAGGVLDVLGEEAGVALSDSESPQSSSPEK